MAAARAAAMTPVQEIALHCLGKRVGSPRVFPCFDVFNGRVAHTIAELLRLLHHVRNFEGPGFDSARLASIAASAVAGATPFTKTMSLPPFFIRPKGV